MHFVLTLYLSEANRAGGRPPSQKFCIVPFWLVGRPSAGVLLPKKIVLFPFGVSFWLVGQS